MAAVCAPIAMGRFFSSLQRDWPPRLPPYVGGVWSENAPLENLRYVRTHGQNTFSCSHPTLSTLFPSSFTRVCVLARRVVFNPPGGHYVVVHFGYRRPCVCMCVCMWLVDVLNLCADKNSRNSCARAHRVLRFLTIRSTTFNWLDWCVFVSCDAIDEELLAEKKWWTLWQGDAHWGWNKTLDEGGVQDRKRVPPSLPRVCVRVVRSSHLLLFFSLTHTHTHTFSCHVGFIRRRPLGYVVVHQVVGTPPTSPPDGATWLTTNPPLQPTPFPTF
jgi:hypothetical protein